jgi:hypothetical protein
VEQLEDRLVLSVPGTPNTNFVAQIYLDLLGRTVDPSGLSTWSNQLAQGVPAGTVVQRIQQSSEYRLHETEIQYNTILGRSSDPGGLQVNAAFLEHGGLVDQLAISFLSSPEFFQKNGSTNDTFLDGVYSTLFTGAAATVSPTARAGWDQAFALGVTRFQVASDIYEGAENLHNEVESRYSTLLGRQADTDGLAFWQGVALQQGIDAVTDGIMGSPEFFQRVQTNPPSVPGLTTTSTTLKSSASTAGLNQPVTFTATVSPSTAGTFSATGSVTFLDGNTSLGSSPLANGMAAFTVMNLAAGSHTISAVYSGDLNFAGSTGTLSQGVNTAATNITVSSNTPFSLLINTVTFVATLTVPSGTFTPKGNILFQEVPGNGNPQTLDTVSLAGITAQASGVYVITSDPVSFPTAGSFTIQAVYSGDNNFTGATSSTIPQTVLANGVVPGLSAPTILSGAGQPTNAINLGDAVTVEATVTPAMGVAVQPTGTVNFTATGGVSLGSAAVDPNTGIAKTTMSVRNLPGGTDTITATFTPTNQPPVYISTQNTSQLMVALATPTIQLTSSSLGNTSNLGDSVTFTATVGAPASLAGSGFVPQGGTVTFTIDNTPQTPVSLAGGIATLMLSSLSANTTTGHTITAVYNGDSNFTASAVQSVTQFVNPQATMIINPSVSGIKGTTQISLTATISPTLVKSFSPTTQAGGMVTFTDSVTGNSVSMDLSKGTFDKNTNTTTVSGVVLTLSVDIPSQNKVHTITITYSGDGNFQGAPANTQITVHATDPDDNDDNNTSSDDPDADYIYTT